ncbi:hypothetical protein LSH36_98g06056 [Paralvinella palmiformis]|uniref:Uncharacterized protein n=1 Tax=Paralvinella palmiformis TaxID=53620 RepID=A0AAD9NBH1_9ANNE|nr:hypothetical protein LSH36_98g06056 [Paralvinella palmiformis]
MTSEARSPKRFSSGMSENALSPTAKRSSGGSPTPPIVVPVKTRTPSPAAPNPSKKSNFSISSILSRPDNVTESGKTKDYESSPASDKDTDVGKISANQSPLQHPETLRATFGSHVQDMLQRVQDSGTAFGHHALLHPGLSPAFLERQLPGKAGPWFPWFHPHPYLSLGLADRAFGAGALPGGSHAGSPCHVTPGSPSPGQRSPLSPRAGTEPTAPPGGPIDLHKDGHRKEAKPDLEQARAALAAAAQAHAADKSRARVGLADDDVTTDDDKMEVDESDYETEIVDYSPDRRRDERKSCAADADDDGSDTGSKVSSTLSPNDAASGHQAANGDDAKNRRKKKTRTVFSRSQVFQLESTFDMKRYLFELRESRTSRFTPPNGDTGQDLVPEPPEQVEAPAGGRTRGGQHGARRPADGPRPNPLP